MKTSNCCSQFLRQSKKFRTMWIIGLFVLVFPVSLSASVQQHTADKVQQDTANAGQQADMTPPPGDSLLTAATHEDATTSQPDLASDDRYRIGPGDVLDIRVFNKPQFSRESVRV